MTWQVALILLAAALLSLLLSPEPGGTWRRYITRRLWPGRHKRGGFTGPLPPFHPNCRCTIQPIEDAMTKTRTPTPTLDFSQAPTITMNPVEGSTQIAEEGHDPDTSTLRLRFHGFGGKPGSLYDYANFGATDYAAFRDAESKGSHFIRQVKPFADRYPCTRLIETAAP